MLSTALTDMAPEEGELAPGCVCVFWLGVTCLADPMCALSCRSVPCAFVRGAIVGSQVRGYEEPTPWGLDGRVAMLFDLNSGCCLLVASRGSEKSNVVLQPESWVLAG